VPRRGGASIKVFLPLHPKRTGGAAPPALVELAR